MTTRPVNHWQLMRIGTLREKSLHSKIDLSPRAFTLTVWFYAGPKAGKQVIARLNRPGATGWGLAIENGCLAAEFGTAEDIRARVIGPEIVPDSWTFAALLADTGAGSLCLSDGHHTTRVQMDAAPDIILQEMIIGGYTDPAGGHYDHTFGRNDHELVDEVRLFDRVLTGDELVSLSKVGGETPVVRITWTADQEEAPCTIQFRAADALHARGFVWDFGDGASAAGREVAHRYDYAGEYRVRLTAIGEGHLQSVVEAALSLTGRRDPLQPVPVFVNGMEGYACFRIPSIVRAANGDLLAFAEGRLESCSDSTPVIHIVSKRSTDNGQTWEPLQPVAQVGDQALMNASPVVDVARGTGRIVLLYNCMTANEWALARGVGRNRTLCSVSGDHGETWSAPRDISEQIGEWDWRIQRPMLGHAVQRGDGRMIHASTITVGSASVFESQNVLIWSDDLGETWQHAQPCPTIGLNEASAVVSDADGLLINSRAYIGGQPAGRRALTRAGFTAEDAVQYGETVYHPALVDPAVQASTLQVETRRGSAILFANPAHPEARRRLTVRASFDECATWPVSRQIDSGPSAYSDLVLQADGRVGVLYERGNQGGIAYVSLPLDWLMSGSETDSEAGERQGDL